MFTALVEWFDTWRGVVCSEGEDSETIETAKKEIVLEQEMVQEQKRIVLEQEMVQEQKEIVLEQ